MFIERNYYEKTTNRIRESTDLPFFKINLMKLQLPPSKNRNQIFKYLFLDKKMEGKEEKHDKNELVIKLDCIKKGKRFPVHFDMQAW